jgi:DNA-binding PadR family transcriptional regulator
MSVRDVILGLLTLGPAYGHQLLFEIHTRLPHRSTVNPGQVYATLTRLASSGLIEGAGVSVEQLPLYRLSAPGKAAAESWICAESDVDVSDWSEVLDVVLLSLTLPGTRTHETCDGIRSKLAIWSTPPAGSADDEGPLIGFVHESRHRHATAVTKWLEDVSKASAETPEVSRGFTPDRPRRGRRPNSVQQLA